MRAPAALLLAALASTSCLSSSTRTPAGAPRRAAVDVRVRRTLRIESTHRVSALEVGQPALDVAHGRVFVGSSDWGLYALSASSGATFWRYQTLGAVQTVPLYDAQEDVVYFGSNDGALYKVRALDGHLLWRFNTNAEVNTRPVLDGGVLYFTNANDTLLAVDATTGELRWAQHRAPAAGLEIAGYAGPLVWKGKVFTAFSTGIVTAFDANTGAERWQPVDLAAEAEQILGELPRFFDVNTTPVADETLDGAAVYVAAYAAGVYALDAETGAMLWSNPELRGVDALTLWEGLGANGGKRKILFAASGTTGLVALDPAERGRVLWRQSLPEGSVSEPVSVSGAILFSASGFGLFVLEPTSGHVLGSLHNGDGFTMTPAAFGTRAFVVSNEGFLYGLQIATQR